MNSTAIDVNPGIVETVELVNSILKGAGRTCDSGDGKTGDFACDRDHAYVCATVDRPSELGMLANEVRRVLENDFNIVLQPVPEMPCLQATYDPANGVGVLDLMGVDDSMF